MPSCRGRERRPLPAREAIEVATIILFHQGTTHLPALNQEAAAHQVNPVAAAVSEGTAVIQAAAAEGPAAAAIPAAELEDPAVVGATLAVAVGLVAVQEAGSRNLQ